MSVAKKQFWCALVAETVCECRKGTGADWGEWRIFWWILERMLSMLCLDVIRLVGLSGVGLYIAECLLPPWQVMETTCGQWIMMCDLACAIGPSCLSVCLVCVPVWGRLTACSWCSENPGKEMLALGSGGCAVLSSRVLARCGSVAQAGLCYPRNGTSQLSYVASRNRSAV